MSLIGNWNKLKSQIYILINTPDCTFIPISHLELQSTFDRDIDQQLWIPDWEQIIPSNFESFTIIPNFSNPKQTVLRTFYRLWLVICFCPFKGQSFIWWYVSDESFFWIVSIAAVRMNDYFMLQLIPVDRMPRGQSRWPMQLQSLKCWLWWWFTWPEKFSMELICPSKLEFTL